jgi:hypothetical protein
MAYGEALKWQEKGNRWCLGRKSPRQKIKAWKKVTMTKDKGGLGLKNLKLMNEALLIKHLHKFYNKEDIPWV